MNSCWRNLYDHFKDRRYGAIFLLSLLAFGGILVASVVVAAALNSERRGYYLGALGGAGVILAGRILLAMRRASRSAKEPNRSPLSCDELRKARSKLVRHGNGAVTRIVPPTWVEG